VKVDEIPNVGHPVGAFGHPWGLNFTGTKGVISGKTSKFGTEMLQTDAPINSGNSGGPLISLKTGEVVGMNTSNISDDEDQNTNFAESMKYACNIISLLKQGKDPSTPQLPVVFFDDNERAQLKIARVSEYDVFGFEQGDVVIGVDGHDDDLVNETHLLNLLRGKEGKVGLIVNRGKQRLILRGELKLMRNVLTQRAVKFSGVVIGDMSSWKDNPSFNDTPVVHSVTTGSDSEASGISYLNLITHVNGIKVDNLEALYDLVSASAKSIKSVTLYTRSPSWVSPSYHEYILPVTNVEWVEVGARKIEERSLVQESNDTLPVKLLPVSIK